MGQSQTGSRTANISLGQVQVCNIRKMTLDVAPPSSLSQPLVVPSKTLSRPGPSNCADRVLQAQSLPTLGHLHPEFCTFSKPRMKPASLSQPQDMQPWNVL